MSPEKPKRKQTGFTVDAVNLDYLDTIRQVDPVFERRSRSDTLNLILDRYRAENPLPKSSKLSAEA
jgi:hypothetical protein